MNFLEAFDAEICLQRCHEWPNKFRVKSPFLAFFNSTKLANRFINYLYRYGGKYLTLKSTYSVALNLGGESIILEMK